MATLTVRFSCGCGFSTADVEEAIEHATEYRHSLTTHGMVRP